jgi:Ca-activated chloride channel family protein
VTGGKHSSETDVAAGPKQETRRGAGRDLKRLPCEFVHTVGRWIMESDSEHCRSAVPNGPRGFGRRFLRRIGPRLGVAAALCSAFLPAFSSTGHLWPQQQADRIRVQTTLVQVPVMVSDAKGGMVLGLKAEDFSLFDDDALQRLSFFAAATEPIRIALVLDTSKSTITVLPKIRKAAADFISQLQPKDQAMVVTFDSEVHTLARFGTDPENLKRMLRDVQPGEYVGSRMRDAITQTAEKYLRAVQGRKAMVLLTDGQDYGSTASPDQMIRAVLDAGVVVYPVSYDINRRELAKALFGIPLPKNSPDPPGWERDEKAAAAFLLRTAQDSAGVLYRSEVTDLKKTFARVAEELRHQYLLAFYPDPARIDGAQHFLRVLVARPNVVVRARRSYQGSRAPSVVSQGQ